MELCGSLVHDTAIEYPSRLLFYRCRQGWRSIGAEQVHQHFGISPDNVDVGIGNFVILALLVIDNNVLLEVLDHIRTTHPEFHGEFSGTYRDHAGCWQEFGIIRDDVRVLVTVKHLLNLTQGCGIVENAFPYGLGKLI